MKRCADKTGMLMRTQIKAAQLTSQICRGKQKSHNLVLQRVVAWALAISAAHLRKAPSICAQTRIGTSSSRARKSSPSYQQGASWRPCKSHEVPAECCGASHFSKNLSLFSTATAFTNSSADCGGTSSRQFGVGSDRRHLTP